MKYAGILKNDCVNGTGVCVSFWVQGCPHHCKGCHNPQTWDFNGGKSASTTEIEDQILKAIVANGITRNFSVLGGQPLCEENLDLVDDVVTTIRIAYPSIMIFLWTGYTIEELKSKKNEKINHILKNINFLIDGLYLESERDITLSLRGSKNQRVLLQGIDF